MKRLLRKVGRRSAAIDRMARQRPVIVDGHRGGTRLK